MLTGLGSEKDEDLQAALYEATGSNLLIFDIWARPACRELLVIGHW